MVSLLRRIGLASLLSIDFQSGMAAVGQDKQPRLPPEIGSSIDFALVQTLGGL